jgi:hypothetical protein
MTPSTLGRRDPRIAMDNLRSATGNYRRTNLHEAQSTKHTADNLRCANFSTSQTLVAMALLDGLNQNATGRDVRTCRAQESTVQTGTAASGGTDRGLDLCMASPLAVPSRNDARRLIAPSPASSLAGYSGVSCTAYPIHPSAHQLAGEPRARARRFDRRHQEGEAGSGAAYRPLWLAIGGSAWIPKY